MKFAVTKTNQKKDVGSTLPDNTVVDNESNEKRWDACPIMATKQASTMTTTSTIVVVATTLTKASPANTGFLKKDEKETEKRVIVMSYKTLSAEDIRDGLNKNVKKVNR